MSVLLVKSPVETHFRALIQKAEREIVLTSPYINAEGTEIFNSAVERKSQLSLTLLTNLSVKNIVAGVTQPEAILKLCEGFKTASVWSLQRLHAKVFIADAESAMISSANLTLGGIRENFEYGALIESRDAVSQIKADVMDYARLGNEISATLLRDIAEESQLAKELKAEQEKELREREATSKLKRLERRLHHALLANRVKSGKTINEIFANTILYLMHKHKQLTTPELHRLVQEIHPDICDDKIDRIINGQRFGKLWKHSVRNAQQRLKAKGKIRHSGKLWLLAG